MKGFKVMYKLSVEKLTTIPMVSHIALLKRSKNP